MQWSDVHVVQWLNWAIREFTLEGVNISNFTMRGRELCKMEKEKFLKLAPPFMGDILWEHLDILQKGKSFVHAEFSCFCCHLLTFFKIDFFFKKFFQGHYQCVKRFWSRSGPTKSWSVSGYQQTAKVATSNESVMVLKSCWLTFASCSALHYYCPSSNYELQQTNFSLTISCLSRQMLSAYVLW